MALVSTFFIFDKKVSKWKNKKELKREPQYHCPKTVQNEWVHIILKMNVFFRVFFDPNAFFKLKKVPVLLKSPVVLVSEVILPVFGLEIRSDPIKMLKKIKSRASKMCFFRHLAKNRLSGAHYIGLKKAVKWQMSKKTHF